MLEGRGFKFAMPWRLFTPIKSSDQISIKQPDFTPPSTSKAPTNASAKSGKNTKTNATNVGTKLQLQEMKSRGSSAFISPLVITLVSMVALDACFHLN